MRTVVSLAEPASSHPRISNNTPTTPAADVQPIIMNMHPPSVTKSTLHEVSIDGLKLADLDNKSDIWTMSPPCQPYTTTRGAKRLDKKDNRSKAFTHLMFLLLQMK